VARYAPPGHEEPRKKQPRAEANWTWFLIALLACGTVVFWRWTEPLIAMARNGIDVRSMMTPHWAPTEWGQLIGAVFLAVLTGLFGMLVRIVKRTNIMAMLLGRSDKDREARDVAMLAEAQAARREAAAARQEAAEERRHAAQDRAKLAQLVTSMGGLLDDAPPSRAGAPVGSPDHDDLADAPASQPDATPPGPPRDEEEDYQHAPASLWGPDGPPSDTLVHRLTTPPPPQPEPDPLDTSKPWEPWPGYDLGRADA
jgi:hypothetical protein